MTINEGSTALLTINVGSTALYQTKSYLDKNSEGNNNLVTYNVTGQTKRKK